MSLTANILHPSPVSNFRNVAPNGGMVPTNSFAAGGATKKKDAYQEIKWNGWGLKDRAMRVDPTDPFNVIHANGKSIRGLVPFAHQKINGGIGPMRPLENSPSLTMEEAIQKLPAVVGNEDFLNDLTEAWGGNNTSTPAPTTASNSSARNNSQIKTDPESRLCHVFGKNYRDLWRVRQGWVQRAPDYVVLPHCHDDVVKLMELAVKHNIVVIPFGGGTNVTGCVEASLFETRRTIVSVDMRRMGRMLSIDKNSRVAVFEAGVLGPDLDEAIGRHGFKFGHDPDSYIFSTLGGWIASRSSGALSNKYGDIENMVLSLKVVTPSGVIETPLVSRPCGPDLNAIFIGSEGHFGIITEACVKIEPIPAVALYEGWMFPNFESGYSAFYECTKLGVHPTAMRLYDEDDTQMSMALKSEEPGINKIIGKGVKQYLKNVKKWELEKVCLVILGHEGTAEQVKLENKSTAAIFLKFGGFRVGKGAGSGWQEKKYDLPFVRDFALQHKMWADVFETSVVYSEAIALWRAVKAEVRAVWKEKGQVGWIGCHAAHQYRFGCCLYFTFAGQQKDERDLETFLEIKQRATEAMLRHRGNLTHHHGIGYEHVPWMERYLGTPAMEMLLAFKAVVDPNDNCNPHKLLPVRRLEGETAEAAAERRKKLMLFYQCGLKSKM